MSVTKAALAFAKIYSVEKARQHGFSIEPHHLQQTEREFEDYAMTAAENVAAFNKGAMLQMQADPTDETQQCALDTAATNAELLIVADFAAYTAGGFDAGEFYDKLKIMQLKQMEQYSSCEFVPLLISTDAMFSNKPNAVAAGMNAATQIGTGWSEQDTSIYIGYDDFVDGWNESSTARYELWGSGTMLTLSQLLKMEAGNADIDVSPTST